MSKDNRKTVNNKNRKSSKNTSFGRLMLSLVILGVVILLFINYALPLVKKEATHVAAEKAVDVITKNADKIAVVTDHGIAEQGTHDELMAKQGQYFKLRTVQGE